jgi:hypothetical protein
VRDEALAPRSTASQDDNLAGVAQVDQRVAPLIQVVSLKVIADVTRTDEFKQKQGQGKVSWVLRAIDDIRRGTRTDDASSCTAST